MRKHQKPAAPRTAKPAASPAPAKSQNTSSLLGRIEDWLTRNQKPIFWCIMALAVVFGILHFDVKISEGNDDALYIEGGYNYAKDFTGYYFTANAPMYPMLLGLVIKVFGMKLIILKLFSLLFFLSSIIAFYFAFKNKIPYILLLPILYIQSTNSYFLYYASQTYTESLFMLLQALFFISFFKFQKSLNENPNTNYSTIIIFGFTLFLLTFCKSLALGALIALITFFTITKNWKGLLLGTTSFLIFKIPYELIKYLVWGDLAKNSQLSTLLQVDPYDATKGNEDFSGLISRFFDNYNLYISKRIPQIFGFISSDSTNTNLLISIATFFLLSIGTIYIIRKKRLDLLYLAVYLISLLAITFVVLQIRWDQPRIILIMVPYLLIIGLYFVTKQSINSKPVLGISYLVIISTIIISSTISSISKAQSNFKVLKFNLKGDVFYGYSPDWENYLKLSQWCSLHLSKDSYVACRKAPMSFVYGNGMKFYPIYNVIALDPKTGMSNPDSALKVLKDNNVTHIIIASLRRNPKKVDGYVINTIHRILTPISNKYPEKLELVKSIGESESAFLYKIKY